MGCCMSTTTPSSPPHPHQPHPQHTDHNLSAEQTANNQEKETDEKSGFKRREVFVIHHRTSHDTTSHPKDSASDSDGLLHSTVSSESGAAVTNAITRAANGAPVRASSCTKEEVDAILIQCGRLSRSSSARKFSGSKRSHDFDGDNDFSGDLNCGDEERHSRRHSRGSHRRRNPSRSRDPDPEIQRSASLDRGSAGGGRRRVSRSPARRSVSPGGGGFRPGKIVSVPATVSSVSIEKGGNGGCGEVRRVLVRRNVGEGFAVSPRSRSPARSGSQASLSRSSSRKGEQSPYRRAPLKEVEGSSLPFHPLANRVNSVRGLQKSGEIDEVVEKQIVNVVSQNKLGLEADNPKFAGYTNYHETSAEHLLKSRRDPLETVKLPPTFTRSRSSRRSRDLDIEVEALSNSDPTTNYNSLLLQDIQKFHQKTTLTTDSTTVTKTPPPLPACISKARSIVDAVAELNSSMSSNLSCVYGDEKQNPHMYVTVRQKGSGEEESSGSCTAESNDRWTSSSIEEGVSPAGFQRRALSRAGCEDFERRLLSGHRRQLSDECRKGMMCSGIGAGKVSG